MPVARDVAITTPLSGQLLLERLADEGFLGGVALSALTQEGDGSVDPALRSRAVVMSATERRTAVEVERFAEAMAKVIR